MSSQRATTDTFMVEINLNVPLTRCLLFFLCDYLDFFFSTFWGSVCKKSSTEREAPLEIQTPKSRNWLSHFLTYNFI